MAVSRDDAYLYVGVAEGEIVQLDTASGAELQRRAEHTGDVNWVAISRDGSLLASASADKTVAIWDPTSFTKLRTLTGLEGNVSCVAFSPNGELIAATTSEAMAKSTRIWNAQTGETVHSLDGPSAWTCAFSTSGNRLFTCGPDLLVVWDVQSGGELQRIAHYKSPGVSVSPDGQTVAAAGWDFGLRSAAIADPNVLRKRKIYRDARNIVVTLEEQTTKRNELRRLLKQEKDLAPAVREAALQRIEETGDDPYELYKSSWKLLVNPTEDVEQASNDAELAAELVPDSAEYAMAAGLGHLRMKRYDAVISTLKPLMSFDYLKSASSWKDPPVDLRPRILAVLAMANHSLGNRAIAESQLNEALEIISPNENDNRHLRGLLREAVSMIKPSQPKTNHFR